MVSFESEGYLMNHGVVPSRPRRLRGGRRPPVDGSLTVLAHQLA